MLLNTLAILQHLPVTLLIFCRILFAIHVMPITLEAKIPAIFKAGLSLFLTLIVYNTVPVQLDVTHLSIVGYFIWVIKECIVGLVLGFAVSLFFQLYHFVGQMISMQGGLSMSNLFDPTSGTQTPLIGRFYYLAFSTLFVASGGFHWFIRGLVESFQMIPVTQAVFSEELVFTMIQAGSIFFELSFKLASPIIGVIFIVDCGLGILARTVPQMNMFVIGIPLKVVILLVLLFITVGLMPVYNTFLNDYIMEIFNSVQQGMVSR